MNSIPISQLSPNTQDIFNKTKDRLIQNASVRNGILMDKTAAEFNKLLSLHPDIANRLKNFIIDKLDIFSTESDKNFKESYNGFLRFKNTPFMLPLILNDFNRIVTNWNTWTMDIYTLSRIFTQQSQQVIVYTGSYHTKLFVEFMEYLGAELLTEHTDKEQKRCIVTESSVIPNINEFRKIYKLINFNEVTRKLDAGDFLNFNFLPEYQAIPHKIGNYIATFYGKDGNVYLTELQYNQTTNQIFPPL